MLSSLFNNNTIPLLQQTAMFAEKRQDVLAGNIANISTPDYKTRDLPVADFQAALQSAVERRVSPGEGAPQWSFQALSTPGQPMSAGQYPAAETYSDGVTFHDGGNRNIESEVMQMTKNSLLYSTAVELMKIQLSRLQAVISERP